MHRKDASGSMTVPVPATSGTDAGDLHRRIRQSGPPRSAFEEALTLSLCDPLLGFHNVPQNVVDAG